MNPCYIRAKDQLSNKWSTAKVLVQPQRPLENKLLYMGLCVTLQHSVTRCHHYPRVCGIVARYMHMYPCPKSHLIALTSVSPPTAKRNCLILLLDLFPTLMNAKGQDIQLMCSNCCLSPVLRAATNDSLHH